MMSCPCAFIEISSSRSKMVIVFSNYEVLKQSLTFILKLQLKTKNIMNFFLAIACAIVVIHCNATAIQN